MADDSQSQGRLSSGMIWTVRALAPLAAAIAGYLFVQSSGGGGVAGCDGLSGMDCDAALASRWSVWLGVPVSIVGAVAYAGLAVGAWLVGSRNLTADATGWRLLELLAPAALGAAIWFIALQVSGAAPTCPFCLAIHACGVVMTVAIVVARVSAGRRSSTLTAAPVSPLAAGRQAPSSGAAPPPALGIPTLGGVVMVAGLVLVQLVFPPQMKVIDAASLDVEFSLEPTTNDSAEVDLPKVVASAEPPAPIAEDSPQETVVRKIPTTTRRRDGSRVVTFLDGKVEFDTYRYPLLGSPDAEHVIVELMNYACPQCRKFEATLNEARARYGDQLAVIVLPVPNELLCNRYIRKAKPSSRGACKLSRLAVAVSEVAPTEFERVHHYLLQGEKMPNFTRATLFAKETVDADELSIALQRDDAEERVKRFIDFYAALAGRRGLSLPSQIVGGKVMEGAASTADDLCEAWETQLDLRPIAVTP